MHHSQHTSLIATAFLLAAPLALAADPRFNATGSISFAPPVYLNDTIEPVGLGNWSFNTVVAYRVANSSNWNPSDEGPFTHRSWLQSPGQTVTTGPSVERNVCYFSFFMDCQTTNAIDALGGNNGCDSAWGNACSEQIRKALISSSTLEANGTLICTININVQGLCNGKNLNIGGFSSGSLTTPNFSDVSNTSAQAHIHGNYTNPFSISSYANTSDISINEYYDKTVETVTSAFFITGPVIGSDENQVTVDMVCVKPMMAQNGSRPIPGAASVLQVSGFTWRMIVTLIATVLALVS